MGAAQLIDPDLFDAAAFDRESARTKSPLALFKETLKRSREYLLSQFHAGYPVKTLVDNEARLVDELITRAWHQNVSTPGMALVAVGGYGRGELHPGSDIDILMLVPPRVPAGGKRDLEQFVRFLWDIGLEVGHSVRSVPVCAKEARADVTVATNLMEARLLCGEEALFDQMMKETGPSKIWPDRKFFEAKLQEQIARHHKHEDTEHRLEPNVKDSPGGLRDIQMIGWVAKRHFGTQRFHELVDHGFLTEREYQTLSNGRQFLWHVRFALHALTGRREDRLLFDHQRSIAKTLGYDTDDNRGVEQFMRMYHRTVRDLSRLNEMLLQHFEEAILFARRKEKIRQINSRFQTRNDFIEVRNKGIFKRYPFALLEMFLLIQQNDRIKGVRATTIRLIRESLELIDEKFRNDLRNKSLFLEIVRQPHWVGHELRRMHRYGVLGAYLPEFARVEGLMQFDLFHAYTVDEHILFVVRNMRRLGMEEFAQTYRLGSRVLQAIPKQELLYLAGIFHDIAKGRGGDHSALGSKDAYEFCRRHGLPEFDCKLVSWLVEKHLLMSKTAQREDINDPDVVTRFAATVGDAMHLNYLYLLTVADISGTNPNLWNSWKDALMAELYHKALSALRRGFENPIDKEDRIREVKEATLALFEKKEQKTLGAAMIWAEMGDDYFIRYSPDEIAWHTRAIATVQENKLPLVLVREMTQRGGTEIFIYMHDHDNIFSRSTRAIDRLSLNILDARIITSANGLTLDTFIVLEKDGEAVRGRERKKEVVDLIRQELSGLDKPARRVSRLKSRTMKHFPIPTRVRFTPDERNGRTIMEVVATDRPGFLSAIGMALEFCGVRLQGAKIATYGERVEDVFFVTDRDNRMLADDIKMECLQRSIVDSLAPSA